MDRRRRAARTVALMSLFTTTDTRTDVPIASFDGDGSDLISLIVGIDPVQAGSGDPSPDNVRPISGWSEVEIEAAGVNLFDGILEEGTLDSNGSNAQQAGRYRAKNFIPIKPGNTYVVSIDGVGKAVNYWLYDKTKVGISSGGGSRIVAPSNAYFLRFYYDSTILNSNLQVELGSTATEYKSYSGNTYTITLGDTVYGGTLDVTTGKLTVDRANIASYNGETLTGRWISDRDVYSAGTKPTIGAQVVYELATPIVYDLTPTQVTTLIGTNNIWADTGDIKYIEYNI